MKRRTARDEITRHAVGGDGALSLLADICGRRGIKVGRHFKHGALDDRANGELDWLLRASAHADIKDIAIGEIEDAQ